MDRNKKAVSQSDVTMEYVKGAVWFIAVYLYFHFIIMGWTW